MKQLEHIQKHNRFILVFLILLIGISIYLYFYKIRSSSQTLLTKISQHILLPKNESPAIATVSDKTKLSNQQFFTEAQNGDILLIYNVSQKAILYRPSIDKIINVTTVNIHTAVPVQNPTPTISVEDIPKIPVKIAIYNGTQIKGLASKVENQLKTEMPNVNVITKGNTKENYTDNLIIDVSGTKKTEVNAIATLMKGKISSLPKGEIKPSADILIILGKDLP